MRRVDRFHRIPALYRLGRAQRRPMTHLVAEAVERSLATSEAALPGAGSTDDTNLRGLLDGERRMHGAPGLAVESNA